MKKRFVYLVLLIVMLAGATGYGMLIYRNKVFPHKYIEEGYASLASFISPWSVGVYEGITPFDLKDPEHIQNPVLTKKNVTDVNAAFIADPFIIIEKDKQIMFFEVLNKESNHGDIGYAESEDGIKWEYKKIIIDEEFHLSYPYVFKWGDEYYLIPESGEDLSVRLYKAVSFPDKWDFVGVLLGGHNFVDPSIFYFENKWWMFSSSGAGILNLYYSNELFEGWRPHPENPIVKFNKNIARPAGRVFMYNDRPHRLAQDGTPRYGSRVFAFEITDLSEEVYEERLASEKPVVTFSGKGWNAGRMHHVDLHRFEDRWIGSVDGRRR